MKNIIRLLLLILLPITSVLAAPPNSIPALTGDLLKAWALTQVDEISLSASERNENGQLTLLDSFSDDDLHIFSIDDLNEEMERNEMNFVVQNPQHTVVTQASLLSHGKEVFDSYNSFKLIKSINGKGNVEYQTPWYAADLYFNFVGIEVPVFGVVSAQVVGRDGQVSSVTVTKNGVYVDENTASLLSNGTLELAFKNGDFARYDGTGQILKPQVVELQFGQTDRTNVAGILKMTPYNGHLDVSFFPEYNYNPAMEVTTPASGQFSLTATSSWGFQPLRIYITSWNDLTHNFFPTPTEYYDGMTIEYTPGEKFLIWLEFDSSVVGSANDSGKG